MKLAQMLRESFLNVLRNKLRTGLAMLGLIIGIASVIVLVGKNPVTLPMDNYFLDRTQTPLDENGEYDYECSIWACPKILCMAGSKPTAESSVMGTLLFPGPSQMPRRNLPVFAVRTAIFRTP